MLSEGRRDETLCNVGQAVHPLVPLVYRQPYHGGLHSRRHHDTADTNRADGIGGAGAGTGCPALRSHHCSDRRGHRYVQLGVGCAGVDGALRQVEWPAVAQLDIKTELAADESLKGVIAGTTDVTLILAVWRHQVMAAAAKARVTKRAVQIDLGLV